VYDKVKNANVIFRKIQKNTIKKNKWKKKPIFSELLYKFKLYVRYYIHVTHRKNNVCDSIIDTLLNIKWMTKDGVNVNQD